ncbi:monooxygenase [Verticiella sediminum]|uniref:Monooxygenase n=1 Tax=Verticiella sediminum TaxID=1247510 RepID=A0A556AWV9_9BURK|nr:FAD-dependent monooxygenase [Verticiella sediminum]TSH97414.1 monooxygenase [Verticiella sediminum]
MKVAIVGGGPSGLFLAILLRQRLADVDVTVYEQNPRDATFGFGVVLADTGLSRLRAAAPDVCADLERAMVFTGCQTIVLGRTPVRIQRPGKGGGAIPRIRLLEILQAHAQRLGIEVHYEHRLGSLDALDADLVVGADGINSMVRQADETGFQTSMSHLTNHFAWFGVARPFENPALVFREYRGGYFVAHYYPYSDGMSTFVAECDHQTWLDLGMQDMSDEARKALFETVFADELAGDALVSNNSQWRQFPVVRNARWHAGNRVLIGDALTSAHFSIGSGTRIAMEDAIALADAIVAHPGDVAGALRAYETARKPEKAKLIDASEASYTWYEDIRRWISSYTPHEFVYRFMTRTGRVDLERLKRQFPELVAEFAAAGALPDGDLAGAR